MAETVVIWDEGFEPSPCEIIRKKFGSRPVRVYGTGPWVVSDVELTVEQVKTVIEGEEV